MEPGDGLRRKHFLLLSAFLALESFVGATPALSTAASHQFPADSPALTLGFHLLTCAFLPGALAILVFLSSRSRPAPLHLGAVFWVSGIAVLGPNLHWLLFYFSRMGRGGTFFMISYIGRLLHTFASPALWGTALALGEDPTSDRLQKTLRQAAGVTQLGFVFVFIGQVPELVNFSRLSPTLAARGAAYGLGQTSLLAQRLLLLWASIQAVRTSSDEGVFRLRLRQIRRLMTGWISCAGLTGLLYTVGYYFISTPRAGAPSVSLSLLNLALFLTATLAATISWELRKGRPHPSPVPQP